MKTFIAILLCFCCPLIFAQQYQIRCASFNIRYDNPSDTWSWNLRKDKISQLFSDENVDIIGMQEVLYHQLTDLEKLLPDFRWVGVGREDGKKQGEYCPVFFKKNIFRLIDSGTFWLSEHSSIAGAMGWDAACPRVVTWVRLQDRRNLSEILLVNTHLDHVGKVAQKESIKLISQWISTHRKKSKVILCGDFNVSEKSEIYSLVCTDKRLNLKDAHSVAKSKTGVTYSFHNFGKIPKEQRNKIDFIFVSQEFSVEKAFITDENQPEYGIISDHNPVWAELSF